MRQSGLALRLELLALGEKLGWRRLPFRNAPNLPPRGKAIKAGEDFWNRFAARASITEIAPALRNAKVIATTVEPEVPIVDERRARLAANLVKAREARKAKRELTLSKVSVD